MSSSKDGSEYGIDLNSSENQKMSEQLTIHSVLQETVYCWLKGTTMFFSLTDMANFTYQDFADHIGCDANEFYFDKSQNARVYTWHASDRQFARLMVVFKQNADGIWVVNASGSSQISMPDNYLENLKNNWKE